MNKKQAVNFLINGDAHNLSKDKLEDVIQTLKSEWLTGLFCAIRLYGKYPDFCLELCDKIYHNYKKTLDGDLSKLNMEHLHPLGSPMIHIDENTSQKTLVYAHRVARKINKFKIDNFFSSFIDVYSERITVESVAEFTVNEIPSIENGYLKNPELVIAMLREGLDDSKVPVLVNIDSEYIDVDERNAWLKTQDEPEHSENFIRFKPNIEDPNFFWIADISLATGCSIPYGKAIKMIPVNKLADMDTIGIREDLMDRATKFSSNYWVPFSWNSKRSLTHKHLKVLGRPKNEFGISVFCKLLDDESFFTQYSTTHRSGKPFISKLINKTANSNAVILDARVVAANKKQILSRSVMFVCKMKQYFGVEIPSVLYPSCTEDVNCISDAGVDLSGERIKLSEIHPIMINDLGLENIKRLMCAGGFFEINQSTKEDPKKALLEFSKSKNLIVACALQELGYDTVFGMAKKPPEFDAVLDLFPDKLEELSPYITNQKKFDQLQADFSL